MAENVKPYNQKDSWDDKYVSGDDLWFALGLVKDRVLALPSADEGSSKGLGDGLKWGNTPGKSLSGGQLLELDIDSTLTIHDGKLGVGIAADPPFRLAGNYLQIALGAGLRIDDDALELIPAGNNILGGIKLGYTQTDNYYPVETDSGGKAFVHAPWRPVESNGMPKLSGDDMIPLSLDDSDTVEVKFNENIRFFYFDVKAGKGLSAGSNGLNIGIDNVNYLTNSLTGGLTFHFKQGSEDVFTQDIDLADEYEPGLLSPADKGFLDGLRAVEYWWVGADGTVNPKVSAPLVLNGAEGLHLVLLSGGNGALDVEGTTAIHDSKMGLYVKSATSEQAGVLKLYNSVTGDSDTNLDGSVTQAALHNAYRSLMSAIGELDGVEFKIASALPTASSSMKKYIYLIPITGASSPDAYAEYVCINKGTETSPNWAWEKIGDTNIDLSGYVKFTDNLGSGNVSAIVADVFGF